jgi:hypothetical protein
MKDGKKSKNPVPAILIAGTGMKVNPVVPPGLM